METPELNIEDDPNVKPIMSMQVKTEILHELNAIRQ